MNNDQLSILYPHYDESQFKTLSPVTCHDLALDTISQALSPDAKEQQLILMVLSKMTANPETAAFRADVFEDILRLPGLRKEIMELLDKVKFLQDFSSLKKDFDTQADMWDLLHRLEEIHDYITCVESIQACLGKYDIQSEGLKNLLKSVKEIYEEASFSELKTDIRELKANTGNLQSITVGINLNERFEAVQVGLVSVNSKPFRHSNIVSHFSQALSTKEGLRETEEWNGDMHFEPASVNDGGISGRIEKAASMTLMSRNPIASGFLRQSVASSMVNMPEGDYSQGASRLMDKAVSQMLHLMVKRLRDVLSKYVSLSIYSITDLIPEFMYYIRYAEFVEKLTVQGYRFCKPTVMDSLPGSVALPGNQGSLMKARDIWNLKLAAAGGVSSASEIVPNDLDFDYDHLVYILTGANRGGKTTITQAVGIAYVLAQGGLYVPGSAFEYQPLDAVYTHFPADEDKTMDLGRLGEECARFKEMYTAATEHSLLLLNETFSTTSFEEGYFIATDAVKAILAKGVRTIYNTHMHKLGYDVEDLNAGPFDRLRDPNIPARDAGSLTSDAGSLSAVEGAAVSIGEGSPNLSNGPQLRGRAASLIVKSDGGNRSFKVALAQPEGMSYAGDIAKKYGVTLEMLLQ